MQTPIRRSGPAVPGPGRRPNAPVARLTLHAQARAVVRAREFTEERLGTWEADEEAVFAARVVVSELVTNAVRHSGATHVSLRLARLDSRIRIDVVDAGTWRELERRDAAGATGEPGATGAPRAPRASGAPEPRGVPGAPEPRGVPGAAEPSGAPEPSGAAEPRGVPGAAEPPGAECEEECAAESGRGLQLIAALASEYGVHGSAAGTRAWAVLPAGAAGTL